MCCEFDCNHNFLNDVVGLDDYDCYQPTARYRISYTEPRKKHDRKRFYQSNNSHAYARRRNRYREEPPLPQNPEPYQKRYPEDVIDAMKPRYVPPRPEERLLPMCPPEGGPGLLSPFCDWITEKLERIFPCKGCEGCERGPKDKLAVD